MKWEVNAVNDALLVVTFDGFFDLGYFFADLLLPRSNTTEMWILEIRFPILSSISASKLMLYHRYLAVKVWLHQGNQHGGLLNQPVEQRLPDISVAGILGWN